MWTPQRLETLHTLWTEGRSASEIAQHLGGVTRNAVIGVVHRRGWKKRIDPNSNSTGRTERVRQKRKARRATAPRLNPAPPVKLPAELDAIRALEPVRFEDGRAVTVATLSYSMCRYPIGDPALSDFAFCGRGTARGRVYCADHAALCYVAPDPSKKPRAR